MSFTSIRSSYSAFAFRRVSTRRIRSIASVFYFLVLSVAVTYAQCPQKLGANTGCGTLLTIQDIGTGKGTCSAKNCIVITNLQGPYDGSDDTLVGVINNSQIPIPSLALTSSNDIFGFDGDGLCTYITCTWVNPTGYEGPGVTFTVSSTTAGVVNFNPAIKPNGGVAYFSLENALSAATTCTNILNNSIPALPTLGGAIAGSGPTNITTTFTPQQGFTLAQAQTACNFKAFDWIQFITAVPDPAPFCANNAAPSSPNPAPFCGQAQSSPSTGPYPIHLTSRSVIFLDPPPTAYTYMDNSYDGGKSPFPFYYDPNTHGYGLSLDYNTYSPTNQVCTTANSLCFYDRPADPCISGPNGVPSSAYTNGVTTSKGVFIPASVIQAWCGNATTAVPQAPIKFTTQLAGVNADGTPTYLGIGFDWHTTFNGTVGGISTTVSSPSSVVDPGSGTGGVTITNVNRTTAYQYPKSFGVTAINGLPVTQGSTATSVLTGDQVSTTASGLVYSRVTGQFSGTASLTNNSPATIAGPLQMVFNSLTAGVSLSNAAATFGGWPYVTFQSVGSITAGQTVPVAVAFTNASHVSINFLPIPYSGGFN